MKSINKIKCNVCGEQLGDPVYSSQSQSSITSLCDIIPCETRVYYCQSCSHVYTPPLVDLDKYYKADYEILINSEEEDQIVSFPDGRKEYRFDLQVNTFIDKMPIKHAAKILDYGAAKSTTLKKIINERPDIIPHVYDVSEMYLPFWKDFIKAENISVFNVKEAWSGSFDIVTSFFSLEHVDNPIEMMQTIYRLLQDEGYFYCIVPNMYDNPADFIVADHTNHFSARSILELMGKTGFTVEEIDTDTHFGAIILVVKKCHDRQVGEFNLSDNLEDTGHRVKEISKYWSNISDKIIAYEESHSDINNAAIYGSGFYGSFIYSLLKYPEKINYFIDQNKHKHNTKIFNKEIIPPNMIFDEVESIYVGLNPAVSKKSIEDIREWKKHKYEYCFL